MTEITTYCATCGGASSPADRFCRACGCALTRPAPATAGRVGARSRPPAGETGANVVTERRVDQPQLEHLAQPAGPRSTSPTWYPPLSADPGGEYRAQPFVPRQSVNGFAIASMVLGIVWIYWVGSILALVFGYMARKQIDESNGAEGGRAMAVAGIVLGWVGVGTFTLIMVVFVIGNLASHSGNG